MIINQSASNFDNQEDQKIIERTSNITQEAKEDKVITNIYAQPTNNENKAIVIDVQHIKPKIKTFKTKNSKKKQSNYISIFSSPSQKNKLSKLVIKKLDTKSYFLTSNENSSDYSRSNSITTRKKTDQMGINTRSIHSERRYFKGIMYLTKIIRGS